MTSFIFLIGFGLSLAALVWARRGDGRRDLPRCPHCWYDMASAGVGACPECGHRITSRQELLRPRPRTRSSVAAVIAAILFAMGIFWMMLPGPWTTKVPGFIVRAMVKIAGAPPSPSATGLPRPDLVLRDSRSPWDRQVWHAQRAVSLKAWANAVLTKSGPISDQDLAQLVPLANEAHELFEADAGVSWHEARVAASASDYILQKRRAYGPEMAVRFDWILGELHYIGAVYKHRPDWAIIPDSLIVQGLKHTDPTVRDWAITRAGRRAHLHVMDPEMPVPQVMAALQAIASTDADARLRQQASSTISYMTAFNVEAPQPAAPGGEAPTSPAPGKE